MDVFDSGRMMVVQDPGGAMLSFWEPKNHIGASIVNAPGAMLWNELATREPEKVMKFYSDVLGWEYQPQPGNDAYHMILNNGRMNGGILTMDESFGDMPSVWMVYFNVDDIEATRAKVKELGGEVVMSGEAEGIGPFSVVKDPQNAIMYVMQAAQADEWTE